ncbi:MAG: benzoate-CoA ligase family protein [Myxococcaceae bacterium]
MFAQVDAASSPPRLSFPRPYNAAVDLLDRHVAQGRAARIAVTDDRGSHTYGELLERAKRAGNALLALGVQPEQRVLMVMLDTVDFPAVFLGAMRAGLVPVPVNTLLQPKDYEHLLADSRARAVVVSDAMVAKVQPALSKNPRVPVLVAPTVLGGDTAGLPTLDEALAKATPDTGPFESCADDVAFWLYSSGSTGSPKGAIHLHSHLMWTSALYAQGVLGLREDDVVYSAAKLFFAYGLGNALTFPFAAGARAVLTAERTTPKVVARMMSEHQPTLFGGVPTLYAQLLAEASFQVSPKLRVSISAGEALPRHVGEAWRQRFGTDILDGIGSTELLHIFLSNQPGDVKYGTSGRPVPGYDLELRGDDGQSVGAGEEGALWVRGPSACAGYWNNREKTLATFHGPWARTGDRYLRDSDGYFTYCGRADDMLKVGGIWVSPFEVESALSAHPSILEAAVVGAPDADQLIKPKAFVVLKPGFNWSDQLGVDLKAFVKDLIAPYKYPRWIEPVSELPKTATGKIQRYKLRG